MYTIGWFAAFVALLIIELLTMGLTTIWFAAGALVAAIAALFGTGIVVQVILFLVVSIVTLLVTRPIAMKRFNPKIEKTNAESLIGQQALVIEDIHTLQSKGRVIVNGQEWSAKTAAADDYIAKDTSVLIEGIQGVKLIVKPLD